VEAERKARDSQAASAVRSRKLSEDVRRLEETHKRVTEALQKISAHLAQTLDEQRELEQEQRGLAEALSASLRVQSDGSATNPGE
jgi:regulator of replication initiation timing